MKDFFHKTKDMSPEERGKYLEEDEVNEIYIQFPIFIVGQSLS